MTRTTSGMVVRPSLIFSRPSSRSRCMPWEIASSEMSAAEPRSSASERISSVIGIVS